MAEIYVTGHRNPDTDSIVAAIAYANLKNSIGERNYKPVRIGSLNDETKRLLDHFGFEAPEYIHNMRTQLRDLEFDHPPILNCSVTMELAWRTMCDYEISPLPIVREDGSIYALLTKGDIAAYGMYSITDSRIEDIPLFNLLSVLEGQLINETNFTGTSVSGEVNIALPKSFDDPSIYGPDSILICGDQPDVIERALSSGVACVIICQSDIAPAWSECDGRSCIISTPFDARRAARLIFLARPIYSVCEPQEAVSFHLEDYVDDVKETMLKNRFRCYPVLDAGNKVVGTCSRYHLLRPRRKAVVLVDHNEASQSVKGLEQVELREIIDHHRLADIQTGQPIYVRNEPVGSTNTIITAMYQENGVTPSPKMAGLMAAAILSDTVLFKSPTCTRRDIAMAERLAKIARVSLDELGKLLFSSGSSESKTAEELCAADFKQFHIAGHNIGVSQITCADSQPFIDRKQEFLDAMSKQKKDNEYDLLMLMLTDVLKEGTTVIYLGNDDVIRQAFNKNPAENCFFLPGVMSRKKQIIPMLAALWG